MASRYQSGEGAGVDDVESQLEDNVEVGYEPWMEGVQLDMDGCDIQTTA